MIAAALAFLRAIPGLGRLLQSLGIAAGTAVVMSERHRRQDAERSNEANRAMLEVPADDAERRMREETF